MRKERALVWALALLGMALLCTAMLLPFVLAAHFGDGWLALNYVTVPGYLLLVGWRDWQAGSRQTARGVSPAKRKGRTHKGGAA